MRMNVRMKKYLSTLLCLCMVLQYVPTAVFAVGTDDLCAHHTEHNTGCGYAEGQTDCTYHCHICHVQEMVDALSDEVTAQDLEAVMTQLTAIDAAKLELSDAEMAQVDFTKYSAAIFVINVLQGQPGAEVPMPAMEIAVKVVKGTTYTLQVEPNDTIAGIKEKVHAQAESLLPEMFALIFAGKILDDSKTLSDYNIQKESTLHLVLKKEITVVSSKNGTVTATKYASTGEIVTLTVTPAEGYVLDILTVTYGEDQTAEVSGEGNTRTFIMPSKDVTVTASFKEAPHVHTFDSTTGKCTLCEAEMAEASATVHGTTTYFETLDEAIQAVSNATAADNAEVTLLKSIDLGNSSPEIEGGVFTLDLSGKTLGSENVNSALQIYNATVTITDDIGGGKLKGKDYGVYVSDSTLIIENAAITGSSYGVYISGGTLTITNATITATGYYGVCASDCTEMTIEGGRISSGDFDISCDTAAVTLKVGADGSGTTFPGGIVGLEKIMGVRSREKALQVLDALTFNPDRHYGNFGVLFDTETMEPISMCPVFDNNSSLFPDLDQGQLEQPEWYLQKCKPMIGKDFLVTARGLLTPKIKSNLKNFLASNSPSTTASRSHRSAWMH